VLAAQVPAQPSVPVTTWAKATDSVITSWVAPDNGGSPITGYTVTFKQSDGIFSGYAASCDMSASVEVTCTIHVDAFRAAPFSLDWGSSVVTKVVATNAYGSSIESAEGNGAVITTTPDAPTDLEENYS
jgi:hypothetical protein